MMLAVSRTTRSCRRKIRISTSGSEMVGLRGIMRGRRMRGVGCQLRGVVCIGEETVRFRTSRFFVRSVCSSVFISFLFHYDFSSIKAGLDGLCIAASFADWPHVSFDIFLSKEVYENHDEARFLNDRALQRLLLQDWQIFETALGLVVTSLYVSIIGDALTTNTDASGSTDYDRFTALSNSFEAMIDEIFVFVAGGQLMLAHDERSVTARVTVQDLQLGAPRYIYATFVMCILLVVLLGVEALRTRTWTSLPKFDFTDIKSTIMASAGSDEQLQKFVWRHRARVGSPWMGDVMDEASKDEGEVRLRLGQK